MGFFSDLLKACKVYGDEGRFEIQRLGIAVPLYAANNIDDAQRIVDKQNSAVLLRWATQMVSADHSSQKFSRLKHVRVGDMAFIEKKDGKKRPFQCVKTQVGHIRTENGVNKLYDANWQKVSLRKGILTVYSCLGKSAPNVMDVTLTYWI